MLENAKAARHDFTLYTDGSGHADTFAGWCAYVVNNYDDSVHHVFGGMSGSSTDRAEFTALLEGLELIHSLIDNTPISVRAVQGKPKILWYSDRESLVGSVSLRWGEGAGRKAQPDLWRRFEHYEQKYLITATHVKRETEFPLFQECDLHASTMRIVVKSYDEDNL